MILISPEFLTGTEKTLSSVPKVYTVNVFHNCIAFVGYHEFHESHFTDLAVPGPERSGNTVFFQYRISDSQQCLPSANTVEGPVGKQCMGSVSSVYTILLLQTYRSTEGHQAVVGQCKPVGRQYTISVQSVCPKYLNEVPVVSQCTTASALRCLIWAGYTVLIQ